MDRSVATRARAAATQVVLVTGSRMPVADRESGLLVAALARRDVHAEIAPWDAAIDWARFALVVLRTPWDYVGRHERFLAWVRATADVTTLVNHADIIAWNLHKSYMVLLGRAGIPVVPTSLVPRGADMACQNTARSAFGDEIVIKPAIAAGASEAIRTTASSAQARAHLTELLVSGDALVQPYLAAVADGEVSLVSFGGVVSHAVRKLPAPGDFRVQEEHGGSVVAHVASDAERAVAQAVLSALPRPTLYARIDLVTTSDGPLLMEAELIEPELFLPFASGAADRFAAVLADQLRSSST